MRGINPLQIGRKDVRASRIDDRLKKCLALCEKTHPVMAWIDILPKPARGLKPKNCVTLRGKGLVLIDHGIGFFTYRFLRINNHLLRKQKEKQD
ncbi:hypothetical protein CEXT_196581 [Caerostris extrusa]|uniref:Uncharacterized protein n=1 Tax=Caerostris extrusa TaxID=172846 RepID=A0AAV4S8J0_CAEEX|nr:hypothetical protein CEXT_196581 [Caerostris extrusa]